MYRTMWSDALRLMRALGFGCLLIPSGASAQGNLAEGAFSAYSGKWKGTGSVTLKSGVKAPLRCQAIDSAGPKGNSLREKLSCTAEGVNLVIASNITDKNDKLPGFWREKEPNQFGSISGRMKGSTVEADASGHKFNAKVG